MKLIKTTEYREWRFEIEPIVTVDTRQRPVEITEVRFAFSAAEEPGEMPYEHFSVHGYQWYARGARRAVGSVFGQRSLPYEDELELEAEVRVWLSEIAPEIGA